MITHTAPTWVLGPQCARVRSYFRQTFLSEFFFINSQIMRTSFGRFWHLGSKDRSCTACSQTFHWLECCPKQTKDHWSTPSINSWVCPLFITLHGLIWNHPVKSDSVCIVFFLRVRQSGHEWQYCVQWIMMRNGFTLKETSRFDKIISFHHCRCLFDANSTFRPTALHALNVHTTYHMPCTLHVL